MTPETAPADPLNAFTGHAPLTEPKSGGNGPLAGRTLAVKDIYDVKGLRTGCGLPDRLAEAKPATATASPVAALVAAGAEIVGKTQCDELCFSLMGNNAFYPPITNPRAPKRFAGGSSTGSAAAVAGGLVDIATASDTGGSVRAPACFCGLIGLRTTHGAIPMDHTMPLAPSLDTFGWFAADADLYAEVGAVLLPESRHRFSRLFRVADLDALVAGSSARDSYRTMLTAVEHRFGAAREASLTTLDVHDRYRCFRDIQARESWASQGEWVAAPDRAISQTIRERFLYGRTITDEKYARHMENRRRFTDELEGLIGADGLLVLPTVPGAAPFADCDDETEHSYRAAALRLLCLSGLSGLPQITVPLGEDEDAPFGVSLIGPRRSDRALIDIARELLGAAGKA